MLTKYEINLAALLAVFLFGIVVGSLLFRDLWTGGPLTPEPAIYYMPVQLDRAGEPICMELAFVIVDAQIAPVCGGEPVGEMVVKGD